MALVPTPSSATSPIPPTKELEDAVNEFWKVLTDDQRSELQKLKTIPDADAVLVFTAHLDRKPSNLGQVVLNFTSYYERVSDLFMQLAKDCPRFAEYQALFPNSAAVQKAICDFNASIIRCCKHVVEAVQRPWHTHLRNALLQSFQQEFNPDLEKIRQCGLEAKQEIELAKVKADHQEQRLQQVERKAASKERRKVRQLFSRVDTIENDQLQQDIRRAEENRRQLLDSWIWEDDPHLRFLWVTFLMDEICAQHSDDDIRSAIRCLPKNLTETFTRALQRITKRGYSSVANAKKAFQWIAVAKRNLALNELHEAMSIKIGQPGSRPGQLINDIDQLSTWCENLVRIDEEMKTVEFAHQAIHTFIVEGLSSPYLTEFLFDLKKADHDAGEICVTYLNFSDFVTTLTRRSKPMKADPTGMAYLAIKNSWTLPRSISNAIITKRKNVQAENDLDKTLATHHRSNNEEAITKLQDRHPFLKYASVHWISHTTRFTRRTSSTWSLWRQVVTQGHGLAKIPWSIEKGPRALNSNILSWSFANRHYAVIRLLGSLGKIHYAGKDEALRSSATEGDIDFVDALLESNFGAEIVSIALQAASGGGHIEVVERLLSAGANVNADPAESDGRTALQAASEGGHIEVVERLLSAGANVNADPAERHGRTALQASSEGGHVQVVERLLDAGANVNADPAWDHGRTALQAASEGGHVDVVARLLDAG
ncbi:ankyrin repeat-containing protein, partial [Colletotrichum plurivorum]